MAAAAAGCYGVGRIAWADWIWRNADANAAAAIALVPVNWNYYRDLAELNPKHAISPLRRAVELNPRNPTLRIELAEYAEEAGDFSTAEESLRNAVALDRTYAPRAEQAQFYFRRHDTARFLKAARVALEISREDARPLFEDCWQSASDGDAILREAIPDRPEILLQYLNFLLEKDKPEAARPVANKVMATAGEESRAEGREALLSYCDRMLTAGDREEAVKAWNWLARRPAGKPNPIARSVLTHLVTNGGFEQPTINRGFDWRYLAGAGLYYDSVVPGALRVTFSGQQPENCDVLWQYVALEAGGKYRLRVKYRTPVRDAGLRWEVPAGGKDLLDGAGVLSGAGEGERTIEFNGPEQAGLGRLLLRYERVKGTVRIEGDAEIQSVELERE